MQIRRMALLLGGASILTSFGACSAVAQATDGKSPSQGTLNPGADIIVTAQRRLETLKNVPMSVNVATGKQIQSLNIFDLKDVQQLAPGLELTNTQGRNNTAILRGITYEPDSGTLPAVDTYFNDIPVDAQTAFTAIYDLDQIEVLRGPQGSLRGRTAPAGAITLRTHRADLNSIGGYVQSTATDRGGYNVQGGVSLPIVPGSLAIRIAGLVDGNRINDVRNVTRGDRSYGRTESGRVSLAWRPSSNFRADLTYQYLNADNRQYQQVVGNGAIPALAFGGTDRSGPAASSSDYIGVSDGPYRFMNNSNMLTLNASWDLGAVALEFNGGHQYSVLEQFQDGDSGNAVPGLALEQHTHIPYNQDTAELRLVSQNTTFWNWTISGYYSKLQGDIYSQQFGPTFFVSAPVSFGLYQPVSILSLLPSQPGRTLAIAGSSRFDLTKRVSLELAARYTDTTYGQFISANIALARTSSTNPADYPIGPIPVISNHNHVKPLTGGATLRYEINPDLTAYFAYGRSYRQPTALVGAPQNLSSNLLITKSEHSNSFEAGLKGSMFDRRLSFELAAFYQKFDGYIVRLNGIAYDNGTTVGGVATGSPDGIVDGTTAINYNGKATVKGAEATITGRPVENWDFSVSASYAHARFDHARLPCNDYDGSGQPNTTGSQAITGPGNVSYCNINGRLGDTPDFSLSANSEVRFSLGELQPFIRGLFTFRPGFHSTLSQFNFSGRENLNLYVGIRGPGAKWEVDAFAKNLLDQRRITSISPSQATISTAVGLPYDSGYRLISTMFPREFGVTTSLRF